jgi:hypothetical protein
LRIELSMSSISSGWSELSTRKISTYKSIVTEGIGSVDLSQKQPVEQRS